MAVQLRLPARQLEESLASPPPEQARERGRQGAIGRPEQAAPFLPAEHGQLVAQDEQLDVLGEVAAPVPDLQPQHRGEGEIGERKQACADALIARRHPHYSRTLWCEDASNRVAEQPRSELPAARETRKQKALPPSATRRTRILEPLRNGRRARSPTALARSCLPATAESRLASSCLDCSVREAVGERCDCE
jgi:hypothetical protein